MLGAINLLPGPNSTEMAIFIGYRQAGWMGLVLGGGRFILPAMLMTAALAWAYVRFGALPQVGAILFGVKPVIIAVVVQALWGLGRTAVKTRVLAIVGLVAIVLTALGLNPLLILFGAGVLMAAARWLMREQNRLAVGLLPTLGETAKGSIASVSAATGVVASLGLMAVVTWQLLRTALVDWITLLLSTLSALLLFRYKTNSAWLVLGGAFVGLAIRLLGGSQ